MRQRTVPELRNIDSGTVFVIERGIAITAPAGGYGPVSRWMVAAKRADFEDIAARYGIDKVTARLLRNRDIVSDEEIRAFLSDDMAGLHAPMGLKDMDRAVSAVRNTIDQGDRIRIIGDYDVDGICASYILYIGLNAAGSEYTDYYLPDRVRDGYGMSEQIVRDAAESGIDLIITCDNGIRETESIKLAYDLGMKVVVTDHHEPKRGEDGLDIIPEAEAVVDPARSDDAYPYPHICGAVVAMKFIQALFGEEGRDDISDLVDEMTVFAALATNCDVMPLVDENRLIMKRGLALMADCPNKGLSKLIVACGLDASGMRASDLGFTIGPCLNATGRLESAHRALELLTSAGDEECERLAERLTEINAERKTLTAKGFGDACRLMEESGTGDDRVAVLYVPGTHESIAGIIAGRLRERYERPVIVLTDTAEPGLVKGSGRSVPEYDMYAGLSRTEELFVKFGGHEQAAGLTMAKSNIGELRQRLNRDCTLTGGESETKLLLDMEMPLSYVTTELVSQFSILEPFGKDNPEPLFAARDIRIVSGRVIGKNRNVGKYVIADRGGKTYELICFESLGRFNDFLKEKFGDDALDDIYSGYRTRGNYTVNIAYVPEINRYMGRESLQFVLKDYQQAI